MQKDIKNILLNQESLERTVEDKFTTMNNKVDGLTKTVDELKMEVDAVPSPHSSDDDDSPPLRTSTQFKTQARTPTVPVAETRPTSSAPAAAPSAPPTPPVSTPPPQRTSAGAFADALLSTPSTATRSASSSHGGHHA